jgi:hypothetical protein
MVFKKVAAFGQRRRHAVVVFLPFVHNYNKPAEGM